jgi:hypothetical protein
MEDSDASEGRLMDEDDSPPRSPGIGNHGGVQGGGLGGAARRTVPFSGSEWVRYWEDFTSEVETHGLDVEDEILGWGIEHWVAYFKWEYMPGEDLQEHSDGSKPLSPADADRFYLESLTREHGSAGEATWCLEYWLKAPGGWRAWKEKVWDQCMRLQEGGIPSDSRVVLEATRPVQTFQVRDHPGWSPAAITDSKMGVPGQPGAAFQTTTEMFVWMAGNTHNIGMDLKRAITKHCRSLTLGQPGNRMHTRDPATVADLMREIGKDNIVEVLLGPRACGDGKARGKMIMIKNPWWTVEDFFMDPALKGKLHMEYKHVASGAEGLGEANTSDKWLLMAARNPGKLVVGMMPSADGTTGPFRDLGLEPIYARICNVHLSEVGSSKHIRLVALVEKPVYNQSTQEAGMSPEEFERHSRLCMSRAVAHVLAKFREGGNGDDGRLIWCIQDGMLRKAVAVDWCLPTDHAAHELFVNAVPHQCYECGPFPCPAADGGISKGTCNQWLPGDDTLVCDPQPRKEDETLKLLSHIRTTGTYCAPGREGGTEAHNAEWRQCYTKGGQGGGGAVGPKPLPITEEAGAAADSEDGAVGTESLPKMVCRKRFAHASRVVGLYLDPSPLLLLPFLWLLSCLPPCLLHLMRQGMMMHVMKTGEEVFMMEVAEAISAVAAVRGGNLDLGPMGQTSEYKGSFCSRGGEEQQVNVWDYQWARDLCLKVCERLAERVELLTRDGCSMEFASCRLRALGKVVVGGLVKKNAKLQHGKEGDGGDNDWKFKWHLAGWEVHNVFMCLPQALDGVLHEVLTEVSTSSGCRLLSSTSVCW